MAQLDVCSACEGFLPHQGPSCPHCGEATGPTGLSLGTRRSVWQSAGSAAKLLRGAVMFTSSGAFALTMMACYGLPPCEAGNDADGDGWDDVCSFDCDDTDASINPGADDLSVDGVDQNCDGVDGPIVVDPAGDAGVEDAGPQCTDEDEDRDGYTTCDSNGLGVDCRDDDSRINPGAVDDTVDGTDDNCDGVDGDGADPDAGTPADAGAPIGDGGAPAEDGGEPTGDGGSPSTDGGALDSDGGTSSPDGG